MSKHFIKLVNNDDCIIVAPLDHKTSCKYGAFTNWCTAVPSNPEHFQSYYRYGVLLYYINKKNDSHKLGISIPFTKYKVTKNLIKCRSDIYDPEDKKIILYPIHEIKPYESIITDYYIKRQEEYNIEFAEHEKIISFMKEHGQPPDDVTELNFDTYFGQRTKITTLNNIEVINGNLGAINIDSLGKLKKVGALNLAMSKNLKSLGSLEESGTVILYRSEVEDLGNLHTIFGDLDISDTDIKSLNNVRYIGDMLYCNDYFYDKYQCCTPTLKLDYPNLKIDGYME